MRSRGVRSKERQRVVDKNQCKGTRPTLPKSYCMNQDSKSCTLRLSFCTFGIMLSQFAAVECNVLIQAGRGSLSRLCFLQHKGKFEEILIPPLKIRGMGTSFQRNNFWDHLGGKALL